MKTLFTIMASLVFVTGTAIAQTTWVERDQALEAMEAGTGDVYTPRFLSGHKPLASSEERCGVKSGTIVHMHVVGANRWVIPTLGPEDYVCDKKTGRVLRRWDCGNVVDEVYTPPAPPQQRPAIQQPTRSELENGLRWGQLLRRPPPPPKDDPPPVVRGKTFWCMRGGLQALACIAGTALVIGGVDRLLGNNHGVQVNVGGDTIIINREPPAKDPTPPVSTGGTLPPSSGGTLPPSDGGTRPPG